MAGAREAHPRSRGENWVVISEHKRGLGSSPLTRGKLCLFGVLIEIYRLIPAHAGKTHAQTGRGHRRGAHPRSRGENLRTE